MPKGHALRYLGGAFIITFGWVLGWTQGSNSNKEIHKPTVSWVEMKYFDFNLSKYIN